MKCEYRDCRKEAIPEQDFCGIHIEGGSSGVRPEFSKLFLGAFVVLSPFILALFWVARGVYSWSIDKDAIVVCYAGDKIIYQGPVDRISGIFTKTIWVDNVQSSCSALTIQSKSFFSQMKPPQALMDWLRNIFSSKSLKSQSSQ